MSYETTPCRHCKEEIALIPYSDGLWVHDPSDAVNRSAICDVPPKNGVCLTAQPRKGYIDAHDLIHPDMLARFKTMDPEFKVLIIKAMGFRPWRESHTHDCPRNYDSGNICNCVPNASSWSQPQDVIEFRHETWDELLAEKRAEKEGR